MSEYFRKPIVKTLMLKGQEGQSIKEIKKTSTIGLVNTYTITLTDGTTSTFTVENGEGLQNLQIGGRNLLLNSSGSFTMGSAIPDTKWNKSTGKAEISLPVTVTGREIIPKAASFELFHKFSIGCTYTQSITVETDANIIGDKITWSWYEDGSGHHKVDAKIASVEKNTYVISSTYTIEESNTGLVRIMDMILTEYFDFTTGTYLRFYHPKIERGNVATDWTPAPEDLKLKSYPVGSIYTSTVSTSPASLFGGTWEQIKDRFLLSAGSTYSAGSTGGEATHTLTTDEMPTHRHIVNPAGYIESFSIGTGYTTAVTDAYGTKADAATSFIGGSQPHNNMPPYLAVFMWKRIA